MYLCAKMTGAKQTVDTVERDSTQTQVKRRREKIHTLGHEHTDAQTNWAQKV